LIPELDSMIKTILIIILVVGFIFWRGTKNIIAKENITCQWHSLFALCVTGDKKILTNFPSWTDVLKEGIKLK
jgi:hypothetical protein